MHIIVNWSGENAAILFMSPLISFSTAIGRLPTKEKCNDERVISNHYHQCGQCGWLAWQRRDHIYWLEHANYCSQVV